MGWKHNITHIVSQWHLRFVVMIHFSEQVRCIELSTEQVYSVMENIMYFPKTTMLSKLGFYAEILWKRNTFVSSFMLQTLYLDKYIYLSKLWLSANKMVTRNISPINTKVWNLYSIFSKYISFVRCTECRVKAQIYSRQVYVLLGIGKGYQILGRLNRRLCKVLSCPTDLS